MRPIVPSSTVMRMTIIIAASGLLAACQPTASTFEVEQRYEIDDNGGAIDDQPVIQDRDDRFEQDGRYDDESYRCSEFERANGEC
jgi:hypothetical protein